MKKPINLIALIISILVAVGVIVGAVLLISNLKKDKTTEEPVVLSKTNFDLLRCTSIEEVKEYAENNKLSALVSDDGKMCVVDGVKVSDSKGNVVFQNDESDKLKYLSYNCTFTIEKNKVEDLSKVTVGIANAIREFFSIENDVQYYSYNSDGSTYESKDSPDEGLLKGEAKLVFSAIDKDETYWSLSITRIKEKEFSIELFRSLEKDGYGNGTENINLAAPKE